ncbi:hypothetical protein DYI24_01230 [Rhodopseudomonas sp. BR0C11]|uniref:hypothetical protein n=1 Tax=Rhodopseudomonas sp. BR0C11 TaxID=2269370 RepID=UPI0013DFB3B7|nr:hypothetical protein [Rhodopseudomonas sp. BR0C11]NEV75668.1 hypothetical protein [Rhodopseudomonas sp. BR0C11]
MARIIQEARSIPMHWLIVYAGSALYLCLLVPLNMAGAADRNMLAIFMIDEYSVYETTAAMLTKGGSFVEPIQKVYGYLYHFLNGVMLVLTRPLNHFVGLSATRFDLLVLRELSVVYYLIAVIVLLRSFFTQAHPVFVVLAWLAMVSSPAALHTNTWVHPDNLAFMLMMATCGTLLRDRYAFGRWFWFAAVLWGLATNTKMYGLFLAPLFICYGALAMTRDPEDLRRPVVRIALAGVTAIVVYFATMPFLFISGNLKDFVREMIFYSATYITGVRHATAEWNPALWYRTIIADFYFTLPFLVCIIVGTLFLFRASWRSCVLLLATILPMLLHFLFDVSWIGFWYLIPTLVPLLALGFYVPAEEPYRWLRLPLLAVVPLMLMLLFNKGVVSIGYAMSTLQREERSPAISLYRNVEMLLGERIRSVKVTFRDPYIYFPDIEGVEVRKKWGLATYSELGGADTKMPQADLVMLQKDYIQRCSGEANLRKYMDYMKQSFDENRPCISFYSDAGSHRLSGYDFLIENEFGVAFIRRGL